LARRVSGRRRRLLPHDLRRSRSRVAGPHLLRGVAGEAPAHDPRERPSRIERGARVPMALTLRPKVGQRSLLAYWIGGARREAQQPERRARPSRQQAGNKEAVASIKVRAQERAENLWAIVADMRNNGHTGLDIAVELRSSRRAVASTVARMTRCFIIEGGDNRKINVRPRARRCGGLARVIATLGPPSHELFLGAAVVSTQGRSSGSERSARMGRPVSGSSSRSRWNGRRRLAETHRTVRLVLIPSYECVRSEQEHGSTDK